MRVLQINAIDNILSTGTIMSDIQDVCIHNGIECHLAYSLTQRSKADILNGYKIGNWFDHKLHALLWRIFRKQAYFSTIPTWFLLRHIRKIQPDVVHLHNLHSNYINLNMLLRYLAKNDIATVVTLHDNWYYTGGCCYYIFQNCNRWQSDCKDCPIQHQGYRRFLGNTTAEVLIDKVRYFSAIPRLALVGVSDWVSDECRKSLLGNKQILTIRNGIRTDIFYPMSPEARKEFRAKYGITENQFAILAPATKWLEPHNSEGFQFILSNLQKDEVLLLYGCTPEQIANANARVIAIPHIHNKAQLSCIYSMADVFINCTREDTCSLINLEAQSCGTPIITFDNSGASETVNNICSFKVPTGDFKAMVEKIAEIKSTLSSTSSLKTSCVNWIKENFSMRSNYDQYVQLYKQLYNDKIH